MGDFSWVAKIIRVTEVATVRSMQGLLIALVLAATAILYGLFIEGLGRIDQVQSVDKLLPVMHCKRKTKPC